MPLNITLTDAEIMASPHDTLFRVSVHVQKHNSDLQKKLAGATVHLDNKYRGAVVSATSKAIVLKGDDGTERQLSMNDKRARQLLAAVQTTL